MMKKKLLKSKLSKRPLKKKTSYSRATIGGFAIVLLLLVGNFALRPLDKPYVLGTSVLARGGDDSGSGPGGGDESGTGSGSSNGGSGSSGSGINSVPSLSNTGTSGSGGTIGHVSSSVSAGTFVDCVGPDGKHFQTSFKSCSDLNHAFHHDNFSFTILKPAAKKPQPVLRQQSSEQLTPEPSKELQKPKLRSENESIELKSENNKVTARIKNSDGTETELEENDAIEKINTQLDDQGIDIAKTETNDFSITKNGTKASTHFPLSVDPVTNALTVTTPSGVKIVTILPDAAVKNVLQKRILNSIETESEFASDSASATESAKTTLTELNNQPVFRVHGFSNKKVLGIIPASFAKTVFVSAETGDVVKTDETFLSRLLETISI